MRIAIVNDLGMALAILRRMVAGAGHEVAWVAVDGAEAVRKCAEDRPDLILMDLIMPVMDGVQATKAIMQATPCAILVVTASVGLNASKVFEAMGHGALDAVATPSIGVGGNMEGAQELVRKINRIAKLIGAPPKGEPAAPRAPAESAPRLVALGASTGGPKALAVVLQGLTANLNAAVIIVQHLDAQFARGLAQWLDEHTELPVEVVREGAHPRAGSVFVSATNDHLVMGADFAFHYTVEPQDYPFRPSVDEFYFSLARHWKRSGVAALLTGMGRDGARGLAALREAGWHTIAQDERTSVVYGMPRAAVEAGAAMEVLPIDRIAAAILKASSK